tara:strand:- start:954 stop:1850 length:897 start_codon:yes stop_codon:yes gene_type:complete
MDYEKFLWDCKASAEMKISKIPPNSEIITRIQGMSTPKVRHCLNNLNRWGNNYLEIGSHKGSTFVSSLYRNQKRGWSIDNYSEFCDTSYAAGLDGTHKTELIKNIDKHLTNQTEFFKEDCFKFDLKKITEPVDVYMYDGDHDQDKQKLALEYFYPALNDIFMFIVDDWNSQAVRDGTYEGIRNMDLCILGEMTIRTHGFAQSDWWSGLYVAFLSKECPKDRFLQTSLSAGGCNYAHPIKNSRPRDVCLRLRQPENNKTTEQIREIIKFNFPNLSVSQVQNEIIEGDSLLEEQKTRGTF